MAVSSAWRSTRLVVQIVPIVILIIAFIALVGYVSWSLHIFNPTPPLIHIDCNFMRGKDGKQRIAQYLSNRTVILPSEPSSNNCWAIRKRRYLPMEVPDSMEVHHSLYFIRIVSKDYDFMEEVMTMMYSPLHFYCYVIDSRAPKEFITQVRMLGACILNIIVPPGVFDSRSAKETLRAHKNCFEGMEMFEWKHAVITQENEIPIHSVHYIADKVRHLQDSTRIGRVTISDEQVRIMGKGIENATMNEREFVRQAICTWFHGRRDAILISRAFQSLLYTFLLDYVDEKYLDKCQTGDREKSLAINRCSSEQFDDSGNCILGMENYNFALQSRNLFVRADPHFDYGFVQCVHELVYKRTYKSGDSHLNYGASV